MAGKISFDDGGLKERFCEILNWLSDWSSTFEQTGEMVKGWAKENLRTRGESGYFDLLPWQNLSPLTLEMRRREGKGGLAPFSWTEQVRFEHSLSERMVRIGTDFPFAPYHQSGFEQIISKSQAGYFGYRWGIHLKMGNLLRMPARKLLGNLSAKGRDEVVRLIKEGMRLKG